MMMMMIIIEYQSGRFPCQSLKYDEKVNNPDRINVKSRASQLPMKPHLNGSSVSQGCLQLKIFTQSSSAHI